MGESRAFLCNRMMLGSKHANLMYECIMYYIYAYQLHCTKQDVLRTSKLLPKVVICINITCYTRLKFIEHVLTPES